jgi:predicted RND superfamily exporter protein
MEQEMSKAEWIALSILFVAGAVILYFRDWLAAVIAA